MNSQPGQSQWFLVRTATRLDVDHRPVYRADAGVSSRPPRYQPIFLRVSMLLTLSGSPVQSEVHGRPWDVARWGGRRPGVACLDNPQVFPPRETNRAKRGILRAGVAGGRKAEIDPAPGRDRCHGTAPADEETAWS